MAGQTESENYKIWAQIEREKRIDKRLRRVSIAAWTITIVLTLLFGVLSGIQVAQFARLWFSGHLPVSIVAGAAFPMVIVVGLLSALVATLATVGIFLRLRTASLMEIQLRLSALEEMLSRSESPGESRPSRP